MDARAQTLRPGGLALALAGAATAAVITAAAVLSLYPLAVLALLIAGLLAVLWHRFLLRWEIQVSVIVLTILLVPLGRYELPGALPFNLEPYRVVVAVIAAGWCATLLGDPALRWRRIGLLGPLLALSLAIVASDAANAGRIEQYAVLPEVTKALTMWASYLVVVMMAACVVRSREQLDTVVKCLVGGGAAVAAFALIQYRTGFNVFDQLHVIPLLEFQPSGVPEGLQARGNGARVYASAQHPIALSAALVMLLPLGIYLGRRYRTRFWWIATALIGIAALSTVARTGSTMLLAVLVVFLAVKPRDMLRLWPYALPFLVAVHFAAPGALGSLHAAFFPSEGLVAQQKSAHSDTSSNRLADTAPALDEWGRSPYLGQGFATRISEPDNPKNNALILDSQWLGSLLELGLAGVLALAWLFLRCIRRLGSAARGDPSEYGWLPAALAAAITAYVVGMFTFDSFAFHQVTFLLFIMIGLSVPAVRLAASGTKRPT